MSAAPLSCEKCHVVREVERIGGIAPGKEGSYGVTWRCPSCGSRALDICVAGSGLPGPRACLNCCSPQEGDDRKCSACGLPEAEAVAFLGVGDGDHSLETAERELAAGLVRRALARIDMHLREAPGDAAAWRLKAMFFQRIGFHQTAALVLMRGAEASAAPALLIAAGFSFQDLQQHQQAIAVYREYLAREPEGAEAGLALGNLANSLSHTRADDEAEDAFRRAIERDPERATHAFNYYVHLRARDRWPDAIAALERGLPSAAKSGAVLHGAFLRALSHAHAVREDGDAALDAIDRALALEPGSLPARYLRGRALVLLSRLDEALAEMRAILAAEPGHAEAARAAQALEEAGAGTPKPASSERSPSD